MQIPVAPERKPRVLLLYAAQALRLLDEQGAAPEVPEHEEVGLTLVLAVPVRAAVQLAIAADIGDVRPEHLPT